MPKEVCVDPAENQICEEVPSEKCEIVPHEECKQITGTVPKKVSKRVTKVMCNGDEEQERNENDIELKTSIDTADVSENEIDDEPVQNESEQPETQANPEIVTERIDESVDNEEVEEVELGVDLSEEEGSVEATTEEQMETTEESMKEETTMQPIEVITEMITTESITAEDNLTEMVEIITTEAPKAVKELTTESIVSSEAPRRNFVDSRIVFSDEAIDNRNKVLATRVFIDDGLLSPRSTTEKPTTKKSSDNSRIFFPDQDLKG